MVMATGTFWPAHWSVAALCLLLAPVLRSALVQQDVLPHFDYSKQLSYVLHTLPTWLWIPGRTTVATYGRVNAPLLILLSGGEDSLYSRSKSCHLMFKCSSEDSEFQKIDLVSSSVSQHWYETDRLCEGKDKRKFKLQKLNSSVHSLTLLKATNISFEKSLKHLMEFRVRVEFTKNAVSSSSLFIYSVDSVFNINYLQRTSGSYSYKQYFLTNDAINFLTGRINLTGEPLMRVNFLEKKFVDLLLKAPALIRTFLSVTVQITVIQPCVASSCSPYKTAVFTTESTEVNPENSTMKAPIDLHSGAIYLTKKVVKAMNCLVGNRVRVTLEVAPGRLVPLNESFQAGTVTVMEFTHVIKYPLSNSSENKCTAEGNATDESLILFSGSSRRVLVDCPFVCWGDNQQCSVSRDGDLCNRLISSSGTSDDGRLSCGANETIPRNGRLVSFSPSKLHNRSTSFTFFESQSQSISYNFSIAEMPLFSPSLKPGGSLPPVTYANLDMRVSFNCTVDHSFLQYAHMSAYIQLQNTSTLPLVTWSDLTLQEFAIYILKQVPSAIVVTTSQSKFSHSLHVDLPHVTEPWGALHIAFVCRAEVSADDAKRMLGLPHYETESRSHVVYFGRRLALQGCRLEMSEARLVLLLLLLSAIVGQLPTL